ncbi:MAG: ATP synthase F1 subunit delta [Candidatus Omnitrophica bacterium]|jgi:F-type H+-transporting ATPase subunit delta|nr:ATP synthase F1 subunit delta [Candidatus Omnitrophota bacterium]
MIHNRIIVTRYAEAFLNYARANSGLKQALLDLVEVKNIIRENPEFKELLDNPEIAYLEKCTFLETVLAERVSQDMRNLLKLLVEKERLTCFLDIAEYIRVKHGHAGQVDVLLKTAFPLDLDLIEKIQAALKKKFSEMALRFYIDLDGSILGGVQVIIGNKTLDGSVKRRLEELKEKLTIAELE